MDGFKEVVDDLEGGAVNDIKIIKVMLFGEGSMATSSIYRCRPRGGDCSLGSQGGNDSSNPEDRWQGVDNQDWQGHHALRPIWGTGFFSADIKTWRIQFSSNQWLSQERGF